MSERVLSGLAPERVMYYFEELCAIPHGSRNTKQISDYCVAFAKAHGLRYIQDKTNNVIIFKSGTKGYENHPAVILQGHLDMVAEKTPESTVDPDKDGLKLRCDGEYICAEGTTLGGDDGIAVAYGLAVLESDSIKHPPLEVVFTVDEEIGMLGAEALDTSVLTAKRFLNADSEDEGILTVSCAGGATSMLSLPVELEEAWGRGVRICVDGLLGGHSGQEINKGRTNANKLLGQLLSRLLERQSFRLIYVRGGQKDNAIPRSAAAEILVEESRVEAVLESVEKIGAELLKTLPAPEKQARITGEPFAFQGKVMDTESTRKCIHLLDKLPNGVQAMSRDIEGLVQTSLNLGILDTKDGTVSMTFSVRSSVNEEKLALIGQLQACGREAGAFYSESGQYPAWEYRKDSPLRSLMVETFEKLYGRKPVVEAIHAGLECGIFASRIPELDCVSFGPDMQDIHTTRERLSVASVLRTWDYLLAILERL